MDKPSHRRWFLGIWCSVTLVGIGGAVACKRKAPPVLFHSDASGPRSSDGFASEVAAGSEPPFVAVEGTVVEGDGTTLTVEGVSLQAPEGERFVRYVKVDLEGDGTANDLAVARVGTDGRARAGALYRRVGARYEAVALDGVAPGDGRCTEATVRASSPRSVVFGWRCPDAPYDGQTLAQEQVLLALSTPPVPRERAALLAGTLPDTSLELSLEGRDLDGDGRDEVLVGLAAGRPGVAPRASARVVFFERAGALARDMTEPAASFEASLTAARQALARGRAGTLEAYETLEHLLRLRRAFCRASGMARLRVQRAQGFECAPLEGARDLYARVLIHLGELPAAEAQLTEETATDFGPVSNERVLTDLERAAVVERAVTARAGPFVGVPLDALIPARLRALSFEGRTIFLRGPAGGAVDAATLTVTEGAAGTVNDLFPRSPDGTELLVGIVETCAGVAVVRCRTEDAPCAATPLRAESDALPPGALRSVLPVLPSQGFSARCGASPTAVRGMPSRQARVLSWGPGGMLVAIRQLLYRVPIGGEASAVFLGVPLGVGHPSGSAVSPDGSVALLPGLAGLWVRERNAWRRWAPEGLAGRFAQFTDLTVSPDGRLAAGLLGTQLWLFERSQRPRRQ